MTLAELAVAEQSAPTGNGEVVADLVCEYLDSLVLREQVDGGCHADTTGLEAIIRAVNARKALGIKRYGTPLRTHNGRDPLADSTQEGGDLLQYITQGNEEADPNSHEWWLWWRAQDMVIDVLLILHELAELRK